MVLSTVHLKRLSLQPAPLELMALTVRTSVTVRVRRVTQRQGSVCQAVQRGAWDPSVTKVKHHVSYSLRFWFQKIAVFSCKV